MDTSETLIGYETNLNLQIDGSETVNLGGNVRYINIPKTSYQELGFGANLQVAPQVGNLGLRFDLNPSYATNGEHSIWDMENAKDLNSIMNQEYKLNIKSKLSYGIGATNAILVPFTEYSLSEKDYDYSLGIDLLQVDKTKLGFTYTGYSKDDKDDEFKIYFKMLE